MAEDKWTIREYEIGYRFPKGIRGCDYETPYKCVGTLETSQVDAYSVLDTLQRDFPNAEWRLLEVRNGN